MFQQVHIQSGINDAIWAGNDKPGKDYTIRAVFDTLMFKMTKQNEEYYNKMMLAYRDKGEPDIEAANANLTVRYLNANGSATQDLIGPLGNNLFVVLFYLNCNFTIYLKCVDTPICDAASAHTHNPLNI